MTGTVDRPDRGYRVAAVLGGRKATSGRVKGAGGRPPNDGGGIAWLYVFFKSRSQHRIRRVKGFLP